FDAQAQAELALAGSRPEDGERALLDLADHLASNSRFDAWGEGLFRVERMSQAADRAGRKELARQLRERKRRIDPAFDPGSSTAAKTAGRRAPENSRVTSDLTYPRDAASPPSRRATRPPPGARQSLPRPGAASFRTTQRRGSLRAEDRTESVRCLIRDG